MPVADSWPCGRNVTFGVYCRRVNAILWTVGVRDRNVTDDEERKSPQRGVPRKTVSSYRHFEMAKR